MWPVVSMPAKKSAAISGNIWLSHSCLPVLGSLALSRRSAKLPGLGCPAFMWVSRPRTMACPQHSMSNILLAYLCHLMSRTTLGM